MTVKHWIDQISPASYAGKYMCTIIDGRIEVTARGVTEQKAYERAMKKLVEKKLAAKGR